MANPSQSQILDCDSSPDDSPRRSWRSTSHPQDLPVQQDGSTRSSSRRSRRSAGSSQPRLLRELLPPGTPPARPVDARRRSAPPVTDRGRSTPPVTTRERSPLAPSPQAVPPAPETRTVLARHSRAPLPQAVQAPSTQRPQIVPLMDISVTKPATTVPPQEKAQPPPRRAKQAAKTVVRARTPLRSPSPQPSTSTGIRHPFRRYLGSSESTITVPSPLRRPQSPSPEVEVIMGPPPPRRQRSPVAPPKRQKTMTLAPPPGTPPRLVPEILELPRTPGHFSSPESDPGLDLTRIARNDPVDSESYADDEAQWDRFSTISEAPAPAPAPVPQQNPETPFSWNHVVDLVYSSGMIDVATLPVSPEPVRSVIGGPQAASKKKTALPPSPLAAASLPAAMRSCWGGTWSSHAQHQPPPPNAALHPGPATWVPGFRPK